MCIRDSYANALKYEQGPSSGLRKVGRTEAEKRGPAWTLVGSKTEDGVSQNKPLDNNNNNRLWHEYCNTKIVVAFANDIARIVIIFLSWYN